MKEDNTHGFKSFGEFLVKVRKAHDGEGTPDSRLKTAGHMTVIDDSQGGFVVPELWAEGIYNIALENAIVRPRATVLQTESDSLKVRRLVDSNRSSSIFGGITFKWAAEKEEKSYDTITTKPALGQLELTAHKLIGSCYASNELENDYGNFGEFMQLAFGRAMAFIEDDAFINGTGAGRPLGIAQSNLMIKPNRQNANMIEWEDITAMIRRLLPDSWNRAVWLINQDAMEQIMISDTVVNNVLNVLDLNDHKLAGFPYIVTEKAQALGTTGDIMLADFSQYVVGLRSEMRFDTSIHVHFTTDELLSRIIERHDGQPLWDGPLTLAGGTTVSPFVTLEERA